MAREMFRDRHQPGLSHPTDVRRRQCHDRVRIPVECAITDDLAQSKVQIDDRRETDVDADVSQFRGHQPTAGSRQFPPVIRVDIVFMAEPAGGRELAEAVAESLYAAPLLIHRDQQLRRAHRMQGGHELPQLIHGFVIAAEQDHATDARIPQSFCFLGRRSEAGDVHHQGSERHDRYGINSTGVPTSTMPNSAMTSALRMRTHPCEVGTPIGTSSGEPWI